LDDEARGDVGAHGFWKRGRTTILDVQICDSVIWMLRVMGIALRRKFWRAQQLG
jgi:hypothetical protein